MLSYYARLIALCESHSNTESCSSAINSFKEEWKKGIWLQLKNSIQNTTVVMTVSSSQISGARLKFLLEIAWQLQELWIQEIWQVEEDIERAVLSDLSFRTTI